MPGTGVQPAIGYPTNAERPAQQQYGTETNKLPFQPHPQAYHEEYTRPPPQVPGLLLPTDWVEQCFELIQIQSWHESMTKLFCYLPQRHLCMAEKQKAPSLTV